MRARLPSVDVDLLEPRRARPRLSGLSSSTALVASRNSRPAARRCSTASGFAPSTADSAIEIGQNATEHTCDPARSLAAAPSASSPILSNSSTSTSTRPRPRPPGPGASPVGLGRNPRPARVSHRFLLLRPAGRGSRPKWMSRCSPRSFASRISRRCRVCGRTRFRLYADLHVQLLASPVDVHLLLDTNGSRSEST